MNAQVALKGYSDVKINAAIASASPHELVQMLFDGLLERIAQMKGAVEHKNIELKSAKVNQAVAIISGLREALNPDDTSELSERLDELYDYIQRRLWQAHLKNDVTLLDECTLLVVEISSGWREMGRQLQ